MNNFTGFDPQKVYNVLNSIENSYADIFSAIKVHVQNGFIEPMSEKWACTEAQTFFINYVKPAFDEITNKINTNFSVIFTGINQAARMWAAETGSDYQPKNLMISQTKIDVSMIKENINGIRGIDKVAAENLTNKLKTFQTEISQCLTNAQNAIKNGGFLGGNQEAQLYNALGKNKEVINQFVLDLNVALEKAIKNTISSYGDTEGKISEAFNVNK